MQAPAEEAIQEEIARLISGCRWIPSYDGAEAVSERGCITVSLAHRWENPTSFGKGTPLVSRACSWRGKNSLWSGLGTSTLPAHHDLDERMCDIWET